MSSSSSWRVYVNDVKTDGGWYFAKHFRYISDNEKGQKLVRTTTGIFVPHRPGRSPGGRPTTPRGRARRAPR